MKGKENDKAASGLSGIAGQLTLEEKVSRCSGKDFWTLKVVERLGLHSIMVTGGPHGLRKQAGSSDHLGINKSVAALFSRRLRHCDHKKGGLSPPEPY
jgi:hypothetical protein